MGRKPQCAAKPRNTPYSRAKPRGRPSKASVTSTRSVDNPLMNCASSPDGERLTFFLRNGSSYTISPADSSPEHFWGTIYSAEWSHPESQKDCTCAIKASDFLLRQQKEEGNDSRAEYRRPRQDYDREVQTFQATRHRNVVEMYDFWEWEGRGYIAMKKLKGSLGDVLYEPAYRSILELLRSDECILAELVRQILEGLDHLHAQNIIYRDVKPDNLLISAHPRMKLADFGNVHFLPDAESVIRGLEGTTSYMSPEMRMGRFYNTKTDIWSLGITLLNVLFDNDTTFPNFDVTGPWGARKFAGEQDYLSFELDDFMQSLFLKSGDRPTAKQLLQHPFVRKADKRAFKSLFQQFPQQNLALPVLSQRFKPDTPPPTPEQQSVTPPESQYQAMKEDSCPDICVTNLTPPVTPSPDPQEKIFLKLVFNKDNAVEKTILDGIKVRRTHGCENREFKSIIEDNLMRGGI